MKMTWMPAEFQTYWDRSTLGIPLRASLSCFFLFFIFSQSSTRPFMLGTCCYYLLPSHAWDKYRIHSISPKPVNTAVISRSMWDFVEISLWKLDGFIWATEHLFRHFPTWCVTQRLRLKPHQSTSEFNVCVLSFYYDGLWRQRVPMIMHRKLFWNQVASVC